MIINYVVDQRVMLRCDPVAPMPAIIQSLCTRACYECGAPAYIILTELGQVLLACHSAILPIRLH